MMRFIILDVTLMVLAILIVFISVALWDRVKKQEKENLMKNSKEKYN